MDGGRYVVALVHGAGRQTAEVLSGTLPELIAGIRFDKPMRWNSSNVLFSRPIRWLLALFDNTVIPFSYAGVESGRKTRGLRFYEPEVIEVENIPGYFQTLESQGILTDPQVRCQQIAAQVQQRIQEAGGSPALDEDLLNEVTNLVEAPTAFLGKFGDVYLNLPSEVLVSVMKKHQRYFPVWSRDGRLLP